MLQAQTTIRIKGGQGSGHFGHRGRPGKVGGSQPSGGTAGVSRYPRNEEEQSMFDFLERLDEFITKSHPSAKSQEGLVLQHGRFFDASTEIPDWCHTGEMKACYYNSFDNILNMPDDVFYTEGYAFVEGMDFAFAHGWLTHADGTVIDPTWKDGVVYFGIRFNKDYVIKKALKTEMTGILPNDWMDENTIMKDGFPPGALIDDDRVEKGGVGSGHFDHAGRIGLVGGSLPGKGKGKVKGKFKPRPKVKPKTDPSSSLYEETESGVTFSMAVFDRDDFLTSTEYEEHRKVLGIVFDIDEWDEEAITDLKQKLADTFHMDDSKYYIVVKAGAETPGFEAAAEIRAEWYTGIGSAKDRQTGVFSANFMVHDDGLRSVHWNMLDFRQSFTNRGEAGALFDQIENSMANTWDMDMIKFHANITVGRYAWAKRGYDYNPLGQENAFIARNRLWHWLVNSNLTERVGIEYKDYLPSFVFPEDFATWDPQGIRIKRNEIPGFDNGAVPYEMEMHLGKAFMLDENGHGDWDAVKYLE